MSLFTGIKITFSNNIFHLFYLNHTEHASKLKFSSHSVVTIDYMLTCSILIFCLSWTLIHMRLIVIFKPPSAHGFNKAYI